MWKINNFTHLNQFKKRLKKALSGHLTGRDTQRVDIGTLMRNAQHIGSISYDTASDLFNLLKYGRLFLFKKLIMVCLFQPKKIISLLAFHKRHHSTHKKFTEVWESMLPWELKHGSFSHKRPLIQKICPFPLFVRWLIFQKLTKQEYE